MYLLKCSTNHSNFKKFWFSPTDLAFMEYYLFFLNEIILSKVHYDQNCWGLPVLIFRLSYSQVKIWLHANNYLPIVFLLLLLFAVVVVIVTVVRKKTKLTLFILNRVFVKKKKKSICFFTIHKRKVSKLVQKQLQKRNEFFSQSSTLEQIKSINVYFCFH